MRCLKDCGQPVVHLLTSLLQALRVVFLGRVKVGAVGASDALGDSGALVDPGAVLQLSYPLPGVFGAVGEEDVGRLDLVASVHVESALHSWVLGHVQLGEDKLTVAQPVVVVDEL